MAIGEQDPARARVDAALEVGWQLGRAYGLEQGYDQARRESEARWVDESRRRLFVAGEVINARPVAERNAERLATIRGAHDAGIHVGGRIGCPWCADDRTKSQPHHNSHYGVPIDVSTPEAAERRNKKHDTCIEVTGRADLREGVRTYMCTDPREPGGCPWEDHQHGNRG